MLKGTLTSALFIKGVSRLVLGLSDSTTAEVTLVVHNGDVSITNQAHKLNFKALLLTSPKIPSCSPARLTYNLAGPKGLNSKNRVCRTHAPKTGAPFVISP